MKSGQKSGEPNPLEELKYQVASELGLLDKVREKGWGGLSARESGQVGGRMTRLMVDKARKG